jgi:predicted permease
MTFFQDFRYALRQLRKNPGFAGTAILILGLGIGATTAIFSAVNPILFEPLPYPQAGRIVMIWYAADDGSRIPQTFHTYRELAERSRAFDSIAVVNPWQPTLTGAAQRERLEGQRVSASYFRTLGVAPALGRDFQASDDVLRGPTVVILSNASWRAHFGADRNIIGRDIKLDGDNYAVIGVMPAGFDNVLAPTSQFWAPLQYDTGNMASQQTREWGHHLRMVSRLQPGVSLLQARSDLDRIARSPVPEFPRPAWASLDHGVIANSLRDDIASGVKPALLAILGAVILVLVIACVNVTNLLLARSARRRGEFAMRAALGAGPSRLLRQLLTESVVLAMLGGAFGMLVAKLGVRALVALSPPELPRVDAIRLDGMVFVFALAITALVSLVLGLIPARYCSRGNLHMGVQDNSARTAGGQQLTRRTLVVAEVAIALVLLSAGLMLRSLTRLFAIDPGFDSSHLLTMQVEESGHRFDDDLARNRFFLQALQAVRQVPGVSAAAFTSQLPLSGDFESFAVQFQSAPPDDSEAGLRYAVSPGYFEAMRIPLRRGRLLDDHDVREAPQAILISESFAKRKFPGQEPLGQRVRVGPEIGRADRPWGTIVGVVGDVKQASLALSESDAFYTSTSQWSWVDRAQSLVVRGRTADVAALLPAIKNAVWSVDRDQPIVRVATMNSLLATSEAERRFVLSLFEAFGAVALVLAAAGIYGVLSGSVTERMREIGVRVAVGATRGDILALIIRQGMALTALGIVIGLSGAVMASHALISLLFGISRLDPATYFAVIGLLAGVSVIACGVPAWRAAQIDPASSLRAE